MTVKILACTPRYAELMADHRGHDKGPQPRALTLAGFFAELEGWDGDCTVAEVLAFYLSHTDPANGVQAVWAKEDLTQCAGCHHWAPLDVTMGYEALCVECEQDNRA